MHEPLFQIVTQSIVAVILGYWLSSALKTWKNRTTFFLTLLVVAVLEGSKIGFIAIGIPTLGCIAFFERERGREKRSSRHKNARTQSFSSFPVHQWDGQSPVVVFDTSQFLYGDGVYEYIAAQSDSADIYLCGCRPLYMEPVETADLVRGCAEGWELPDNVQRAVDALNKEIASCEPVSWEQDDVAIDLVDLKERAKVSETMLKSEL